MVLVCLFTLFVKFNLLKFAIKDIHFMYFIVSPVNKIIISKDSLKKLCNDMIPLSFKSISEINYTKLNSISFRLIGCYGNYTLIARLLLDKEIIDQQMC